MKKEPGSFHWFPVTGPEAMDTNLTAGGFISTSGNTFFTMRVTEHWYRLPTEAVDSPSLETPKSHLDMVLVNWL